MKRILLGVLDMDDGRFLLTDYKKKKAYILFELPDEETLKPMKDTRKGT